MKKSPGKRVASADAAPGPVQRSAPGKRSQVERRYARPSVQRAATGDAKAARADEDARVHQLAADGLRGGGGSLPYLESIQRSFGGHDVSGVRASVGGAAADACAGMGASAYATGDQVAFAGQPSLHTAAHEAAHVVQQRAGVSLQGGVGQTGDRYEQHADAVADRVVRGESAEGLLDQMAGGASAGAVQRAPAVQMESNEGKDEGSDAKDPDAEHEKKVSELVAAGKHLEAVEYIRDTYGFTGYNVEWKIADDLGGAWATTGGEIKTGAKQTIKVAKKLFAKSFPFIVRTIGHEFQHVVQRSGDDVITDQPTREFLSWSWEALDESVPKYDLQTAAYHAKKSLQYWERMTEDNQKKYAERKQQVDALIKKADEAKGK